MAMRSWLLWGLLLAFLACGHVAAAANDLAGAAGALGPAAPAGVSISQSPVTSDESDATAFEGPDGSRKSMDDMLRWAILHSDPEQLKAMAAAADADSRASLSQKQRRVAELLEAMKHQPTEAELMQQAIAILSNHSSTVDELHRALQALQILVEPLDNANNLQAMGGIDAVMAMLTQHQQELQAAAAGVLATASSNNDVFQQQLVDSHPDALLHLLSLAASDSVVTASKALLAVGNLVRNLDSLQSAFYQGRGFDVVQLVLEQHSSTKQMKRRALNLVSDLLMMGHVTHPEEVQEHVDLPELTSAVMAVFASQDDAGLREEALFALQALASVPGGTELLSSRGLGSMLEQHLREQDDPDALDVLVSQELLQQLTDSSVKDEL